MPNTDCCVVLRIFREYLPNLLTGPLKNQNRPFSLITDFNPA